jgi:hypothetical protein
VIEWTTLRISRLCSSFVLSFVLSFMYMLAYRDHGHHDLSCDGNKNWTFSIICLLRSRFGSPRSQNNHSSPHQNHNWNPPTSNMHKTAKQQRLWRGFQIIQMKINTKQNTHAHINMYQTCIRAKNKVEFADVQRWDRRKYLAHHRQVCTKCALHPHKVWTTQYDNTSQVCTVSPSMPSNTYKFSSIC